MFYDVIPAKALGQNLSTLTYHSDTPYNPGQIVLIPFGRQTVVGVVKKSVKKVNFPTKDIIKPLYDTPLPAHLLSVITWLSDYYVVPLSLALSLFLPTGLTKTRRQKTEQTSTPPQKLPLIPLNLAQKTALKALVAPPNGTKLLHGITGSGKTNIYLELTKNALKAQKSTILLVPEIALTSQLVRVFEETFGGQITLMHSRQTEAQRHLIWEKIHNSNTPQIIIGPRSALFTPVKNLGLIIIDEAHDSSYYQDNPPRYSALRLASFIAQNQKIPCILGTATPNIVDYHLALQKNTLVSLPTKAKTTTPIKTTVVDFHSPTNFSKNRYFSNQLLASISDNLEKGYQTLIFHNRRGSAPITICQKCGWQALCPHCFLPLTLHSDRFQLICHACGYHTQVPTSCPSCGHPDVIHKGFGTKLLESELKKLFKTAKIVRFDTDNTKGQTLDALYHQVKAGDFDIIIGTQTVAKGLDLPKLATVGIVQADSGLALPDFSAEERTFELITQVIGRIGRGHLKTAEAIIQTFQPDHPVIQYAIKNDYASFYEYLIEKRRKEHLPPFTYLAKVSVTFKTEQTTLKHISALKNQLQKHPKISCSQPMPAFHERSKSGYTWQLVVKSPSRTHLVQALSTLNPSAKPRIFLDPPSLL